MNTRSPWMALLVAVVVAAVVVVADRFAPAPSDVTAPTAAPSVEDPVAGSSVCVVGDGREGTTLETVIARPSAPGSGPATVEVDLLQEGETASTSLPPLFPSSHAQEPLDAEGDDVAAWVRWGGAPASVAREWRWEGGEDLPAATVAGPCAQPFSSQWVIPGMSTAGGNEARIRLANPFRTDATIAIHFVTTEGVREPIALQNWTVPARTVREININEVIPEVDDLAAVVDVATGRLSVEGYQIARAAIGGIDGGSLLAAAPDPSEAWTVPWIADGDGATSWLWIVNNGERTAPVELTLHTPGGGEVPDGLAELTVPPGELRRVDLSGTFPEGAGEAAVTVRSDGAPVTVSAATRQAAAEVPEDEPTDTDEDEPDEVAEEDLEELLDVDAADDGTPATAPRTGLAVQLGVAAGDPSWVVSGGATDGRTEQLRLVNPSGDPATVDIRLFDGTSVLEPEDLQGIDVPAGSASAVEVTDHLGDVAAWSAFVVASDGDVIVGRVGSGGADALRLIAVPGVPGGAAVPAGPALAGTESPGLVYRMGTSSGLQDADPFDSTAPAPEADDPPPAPEIGEPLAPDGAEDDAPLLEGPADPDGEPDPADDDEVPDPGEGA